MGSRPKQPILPFVLAMLMLGSPLAAGQSGSPSPDQSFSYNTGQADVNDVAITSSGGAASAVLSDASGSSSSDGEVCAWDLAASSESSSPHWGDGICADPNEGLVVAPEGMGVTAAHKTPGGSDTFIVGAREGTGDDQANIYVWSLGGGSETFSQVRYPGDQTQPGGAVQDLFFLDARTIVAWHAGELSLLKHQQGQRFDQVDTWSPSGTLQHVAVSDDGARLLASSSTSETGSTSSTIQLHLLEEKSGELVVVSNQPAGRDGASNVVDLDEDGDFAVLATDKPAIFYYQVVPENQTDDDDQDFNFSASPYGTGISASPTAVSLSPNGERFAVGLQDGSVALFEQTRVVPDGPRAASAGSFETPNPPSEVQFTKNGRQLFVTAGALLAFHARQFEQDRALEPIWRLPNVNVAAFSDNAQRFIVAKPNTVEVYQQAFKAEIEVSGPDTVQPGEAVSLAASVRNVGSTFDTYRLGVKDVPSTWSVQFNQTEIGLLPGEHANATVNLTPSRTQTPTNLTFDITATRTADPGGKVVGSGTYTLTVPVVRGAGVAVANDRVEASRGQTATLTANITNTGNTETPIHLDVSQDEDWTVTIDGETGSDAEVTLGPGASRSLRVGLAVPDGAREGSTNTVTLTARPAVGGAQSQTTVDVLVEPSYGATLSGPTETLETEPGGERTFEVTLQNTGNTPDTFTLKAFSNASNPDHLWRASLSQTSLDVPAGGSGTVDVTVNVPRGAEKGESTEVTITARSTTTDEKVDEATFTLEVPEETDDSPLALWLVPAAIGLAALVGRRRRR